MKYGRTKKILVVEDSMSDVFLLEHMLDSAGSFTSEIRCASRLIDAFRLIDSEAFDVILLDLNLRDMDGVASVAALNAQVPDTPIIVYTGTDTSAMRQSALLCGARDYLVKGREDGSSLQHAIDNVAYGKPVPAFAGFSGV